MVEYVVDFVPAAGWQKWYSADDPEPRSYDRTERSLPLNVRLTRHCNARVSEGWKLVSVGVHEYYGWPAVSLFFAKGD